MYRYDPSSSCGRKQQSSFVSGTGCLALMKSLLAAPKPGSFGPGDDPPHELRNAAATLAAVIFAMDGVIVGEYCNQQRLPERAARARVVPGMTVALVSSDKATWRA